LLKNWKDLEGRDHGLIWGIPAFARVAEENNEKPQFG
jgi:hypothetical protein